MPELPEVEALAVFLREHAVGSVVGRIDVAALSVLQTADPRARLTELYELRDPLYRETAHLTVETGSQSLASLVQRLLQQLLDAQSNPAPEQA